MKPDPPYSIFLKSRLGYMNENDRYNPTLIAANYQERKLHCVFVRKHKFNGIMYDCSPQVVIVLYSVHHDHYLINILLPLFRDDTNEWVNQNFEDVKNVYITVSRFVVEYLEKENYCYWERKFEILVTQKKFSDYSFHA